MGTPHQRLHSRYRGALAGAAVADALAFPLQNYSRNFLVSVARSFTDAYEASSDGAHPAGQYTDDTQNWIATIDSILEREGLETDETSAQLVVDHLIPLWRDLLVVDADEDMNGVMHKIVKGITPWNEAALPAGRATCGAVTRALPIGLWSARSPDEIPAHVENLVGITHRDPRVLAVASGCAAAIASNVVSDDLILGTLLDRTARAATAFDERVGDAVLDMPRFLSQTEDRATEMILDVCSDDDHSPRNNGLGNYVVPVLLIALYQFLKKPHEFTTCVDRCIRLGGQISTLSSVAGALSGSFNGFEHLPQQLVGGLIENAAICDRVDEFFELRGKLLRKSQHTKADPTNLDEDAIPVEDHEDLG